MKVYKKGIFFIIRLKVLETPNKTSYTIGSQITGLGVFKA